MPRPHPVKTELARLGQTQRDLAAAIGYSPGTVSQVLNGHVSAWPELRARVARYLNTPEGALFPAESASADLVARTTAAQGLPLHVDDPDTIDAIAGHLAGGAR